jgi:hypothetical protein
MRSTTMTQVRYVVLLALVWAYGAASDGQVLAAGVPTSTAYCGDSICQSWGCSHGGNETPGNGCVEDAGNCAEDCGFCGDTWCSPEIGEDIESCVYDCGYCGDDVCIHPWESNPSNRCVADCGDPNLCDPAECETNADCSGGDICSASQCCVAQPPPVSGYCGGACLNNSECCGGDICVSDEPFDGYCGMPDTPGAVCPSAPTCSSHSDCNAYGGLPTSYCDFSVRTGICRYTTSSTCVVPAYYSTEKAER